MSLMMETENRQNTELGRVLNPEERIHTRFCILCDCPIVNFGRLSPCLHTFCLICATDMHTCAICNSQIFRVERITLGSILFISPLTLQSFKNEESLKQHTKRAYTHLIKIQEKNVPSKF